MTDLTDLTDLAELARIRATRPAAVREAAAQRPVRSLHAAVAERRLLIVAADHSARGALKVGDDPLAMADRGRLLERLQLALSHERVDGVLATADIVDDLLLLGALDNKVVLASMNRGGLAGSAWELDDRFTGYDAAGIEAMGFDGGKMLLRIDLDDPDTNPTLEACARVVAELAARELTALVEPLPMRRTPDGRLVLSEELVDHVRAATVTAAFGSTSAHTWLKLPVSGEIEQVLRATSLPTLLLGGDPGNDPDRVFDGWRRALRCPTAMGLVPGRALLYPSSGDVAAAVDQAAQVVDGH